jgi:hypothetical protein
LRAVQTAANLVDIAGRDLLHRECVALGKAVSQLSLPLDVPGDIELPFGRAIVGLEGVVADRPVASVAPRTLCTEVFRSTSMRGAAPSQCIPLPPRTRR